MNNGFDRPEDMQRMQQEAIRRVQEMQARARSTLERNQPAPEPPSQQQGRRPLGNNRPHLNEERRQGNNRPAEPRPAPPTGERRPEHQPVVAAEPHQKQDGLTDIFDALLSDSERTLILLLLLLLVDEKADTGLIMALMYLLI